MFSCINSYLILNELSLSVRTCMKVTLTLDDVLEDVMSNVDEGYVKLG